MYVIINSMKKRRKGIVAVAELTESHYWWKMAGTIQWTGLGASGWRIRGRTWLGRE